MQGHKEGVFIVPIVLAVLFLAGFVLSTTLNKTTSKTSKPLVLSEETSVPTPTPEPKENVEIETGDEINESSSNSIKQKTSVKVKIENGEGYIRIDNNGEITEESF